MSHIKVYTNSRGSGDWIYVVSENFAEHFGTTETLFEGHSISVDDLVELMHDAGRIGPSTVTKIDLTDEQMEELL
jgi:hypothetical protein